MKVYLQAYSKYFEVSELRECTPFSKILCEVNVINDEEALGWWLVVKDNVILYKK